MRSFPPPLGAVWPPFVVPRFPLRTRPVLGAKEAANIGCFLPTSLSCAARLLRAQRDARFHSTRGFASPRLAVPRCVLDTRRLARWQRVPVTGGSAGYIPAAALTQQALETWGVRGGKAGRVSIGRDGLITWVGEEVKKKKRARESARKGRRNLLGIVSQRKIFL